MPTGSTSFNVRNSLPASRTTTCNYSSAALSAMAGVALTVSKYATSPSYSVRVATMPLSRVSCSISVAVLSELWKP